MKNRLETGSKLFSSLTQSDYEVGKLIGAGSQGEVYEVKYKGNKYALKWYFEHTASQEQKSIINNLIENGSPDKRFLWPIDIIVVDNLFGYVMPLRPSNYYGIVDLMKRKSEPTFATLCMVGFNLASGYRQLHSKGYSYRDISFGNLFFNPDNGDILICDNDNVSVDGVDASGVLGTPRFMAPEIVRGEGDPSIYTDLFSMTILLFYLFMLHHPLEGALEADIKCLDTLAMHKLYGKEPLFIWDPNNVSNRPVPGYQDNAIIFWNIYPIFLKDMFTRAFTDGINIPDRRIRETEWLDAFIKLKNSIIYCQNCGKENFFDLVKFEQGENHVCWACCQNIMLPPRMEINKHLIMLNRDTKLYEYHILDNYNCDMVTAEMNRHPKKPAIWGLKNLTEKNWIYTKANGTDITIEPGKSAPLAVGVKIRIESATGEIKT